MPLVNAKNLLKTARENHYAVPAFNFTNLEQLDGILEQCEAMQYPVIIQTSKKAMDYMGVDAIIALVKQKTAKLKIDVCLNLDHGKDDQICKKAVDAGYTNVMIDASELDYESNISLTKKVVEYAHAHNVTVEAELGSLKGVEDEVNGKHSHFTDPKQAADFVKRTKVDSLAVSIGTSHGAYKFDGSSKLDLKRLEAIAKVVTIPLVLHGASSVSQTQLKKLKQFGGNLEGAKGVSESQIASSVKLGIAKVNMDTDLRIAFTLGVRETLQDPKVFDLRDYLSAGKEEMKQLIAHKIKLLSGK